MSRPPGWIRRRGGNCRGFFCRALEGGISMALSVVSSHILAELEDYSDRMIIVDRGRIAGGETISLRDAARTRLRIVLAQARRGLTRFSAAAARGVEILAGQGRSAFWFLISGWRGGSGRSDDRACRRRRLLASRWRNSAPMPAILRTLFRACDGEPGSGARHEPRTAPQFVAGASRRFRLVQIVGLPAWWYWRSPPLAPQRRTS